MNQWVCDDSLDLQLFAEKVNKIPKEEAERIIKEYDKKVEERIRKE